VDVVIRAAEATDLAAVRALMHGERLNPLGVDWRNFVVAGAEEGVVGCAQLRPAAPDAVELGTLLVRGDLRRGGLGARLVEAALARAQGRRVFVVTDARHAVWYARWGFRTASMAEAPWPVRRNWLLGQAGSLVALAHGMRPRRLAILERVG
jgi:N-acetylglutamate synthase-like GNAT family acetyltransferase